MKREWLLPALFGLAVALGGTMGTWVLSTQKRLEIKVDLLLDRTARMETVLRVRGLDGPVQPGELSYNARDGGRP